MIDWFRRADPAFYDKERFVLQAEARVPRYSEEAQAESRLAVLREDRVFQVALAIVALALVLAAGFHAFAAAAAVAGLVAFLFEREARSRPQLATWTILAVVLLTFAYAFAFEPATLAARVPLELAAEALAYLGVCTVAGRIRRAELLARPEGLVSLPQSIVPLLDRSHHHAIICWRE